MNTPEPVNKYLNIVGAATSGLNSKAQVIKKLTKKQLKFKKSVLLQRSQMMCCERCKKAGGTLRKLPHMKDGRTLYIHERC